jgi:hypothetical protein
VSGRTQVIDVAGAGLDSKQSTSSMTAPGWNGPQAVVVRWNAIGSACKNMIHRSEGRGGEDRARSSRRISRQAGGRRA